MDNDNMKERLIALEINHENLHALLIEIKDAQSEMAERIRIHMEKEESVRWKIAAGLISMLFITCVGLISVIFYEVLI